MKQNLFLQILLSVIGTLVGIPLFTFIFSLAAIFSTDTYYQEIIARIVGNTATDFVGGLLLLIIINVLDSKSDKPRYYWYFGTCKGFGLPLGACFLFGMFAPLYTFSIILNYIRNVKDRLTLF